jgi:hypothetical protein
MIIYNLNIFIYINSNTKVLIITSENSKKTRVGLGAKFYVLNLESNDL